MGSLGHPMTQELYFLLAPQAGMAVIPRRRNAPRTPLSRQAPNHRLAGAIAYVRTYTTKRWFGTNAQKKWLVRAYARTNQSFDYMPGIVSGTFGVGHISGMTAFASSQRAPTGTIRASKNVPLVTGSVVMPSERIVV